MQLVSVTTNIIFLLIERFHKEIMIVSEYGSCLFPKIKAYCQTGLLGGGIVYLPTHFTFPRQEIEHTVALDKSIHPVTCGKYGGVFEGFEYVREPVFLRTTDEKEVTALVLCLLCAGKVPDLEFPFFDFRVFDEFNFFAKWIFAKNAEYERRGVIGERSGRPFGGVGDHEKRFQFPLVESLGLMPYLSDRVCDSCSFNCNRICLSPKLVWYQRAHGNSCGHAETYLKNIM